MPNTEEKHREKKKQSIPDRHPQGVEHIKWYEEAAHKRIFQVAIKMPNVKTILIIRTRWRKRKPPA